jgi:hypothetical protein
MEKQGMKNYVKFAIAAAVLAAPVQSYAASGDVLFDANVDNSCSINVTGNGTLKANVGLTQLSSTNAGGAAGTATVVASSADFTVSTDAPSAWSGPTTPDTVSSSHAGFTGVGSSDVTVNMSAATTSGSFQTGAYSATVVLRCE